MTSKNEAKFVSYKAAWSRINRGLEDGFYFEVVTICESIISDRLLSYVRWADPNGTVSIHGPFKGLIDKWRKLTEENAPEFKGSSLVEQIEGWRQQRNNVIHGLVKSEPGTPTKPIDEFLRDAQAAAETGKKLANAVQNWHRNQKRRSEQQMGKLGD